MGVEDLSRPQHRKSSGPDGHYHGRYAIQRTSGIANSGAHTLVDDGASSKPTILRDASVFVGNMYPRAAASQEIKNR